MKQTISQEQLDLTSIFNKVKFTDQMVPIQLESDIIYINPSRIESIYTKNNFMRILTFSGTEIVLDSYDNIKDLISKLSFLKDNIISTDI